MDINNALALFYVIMFGQFFGNFLSCDLQRMFSKSVELKHFLALISVFFLLTSIDTKIKVVDAMKVSAIVYFLYIASTKSKAVTVVPMLFVLAIDQGIKVYLDTEDASDTARKRLETARSWLGNIVLSLIAVGFAWYFIRSKMEFGNKFSYYKFVMGTNECANK